MYCGVVCVELLVAQLIAICLPAGQHQSALHSCRLLWPKQNHKFSCNTLFMVLYWHSLPPFKPQAADFAAVLLKLITPFHSQ